MATENQMEYVSLGQSGLKISKVILGTMSYGSSKWQDWVLDEEQALPLLEYAFSRGINTWDTADIYSHGRSEEIIGKALAKYHDRIPRHRVVIMTKCFYGVADQGKDGEKQMPPIAACARNEGGLVNRVGLSRKHIFDAVDASIKRLGTYIDVLQIHRLDRETPREEIMRALNDVVESGKVRYIGASTMAAWEFQSLNNLAERKGWHKFISMQNYHNLISREEEREMIPYCLDAGIGLIPWSPLARGLLARPWRSAPTLRESTDGALNLLLRSRETEADREIVNRVEEISKKKGVSMAQVAIAWSLSHPNENPILGLSSKDRIDEAVASIRVKLSEEEIKYLEEPYVPKMLSPLEK
ncbi:aldo/keto reductase [Aspergillus lucknowensis]|uniref:NADP-dependent oxidoreductase domain-containing protein n=1 Tax=Aspergillus lucknowensis TaxID=176173 RepID=A0ABR4LPY7_9EURO